MKINILLRDKKEITTDLSEEEYQTFKKSLIGQAKMVEIEDLIINTSSIVRVEPLTEQRQLIPKEFRLPETATETEKERELSQIGHNKGMEGLFNRMKSLGLFKEFSSYQDWEEKRDKFGINAEPKTSHQEFLEALPAEEKKQFAFAFGEKQDDVNYG